MAAEGKNLTDQLDELILQKIELDKKIDEVKKNLIEFARHEKVNVVYGTWKKANVKEYEKVIYPEDKEKFISIIKEKGLYEELSSLNYLKLNGKILKNQIDKDIMSMIKKQKEFRVFISGKKQ